MQPEDISLDNVKVKPPWMRFVPWTMGKTCHAIYPYTYLPQAVYDDVRSSDPNPWNVAVVLHEQEHLRRQEKEGPMRWYLHYVFSGRFRFEEELAASVPQIAYLKATKQDKAYFIRRRSKMLSGWLYLWCVSQSEARRRLEALWEQA